MEDEIKHLSLILLLFAASCTSYHKIEGLYGKAHFAEAYTLLQKERANTPKYQEYEFKLIFMMVLGGEQNYLPLLESLMQRPAPDGAQDAYAVAAAWNIYVGAKNNADFKKILEALPARPLGDVFLEKTRLAIQSQSLLNLGRYQEVIHNLKGHTGKNSELIYLLACAKKNLGEIGEALELYKDVVRISDSDILRGLACFHSGEIYEQNQNTEAARTAYLQSWDYASTNSSLNFKLGRLLSGGSYESLPARFYRAALRLDENHAEAWYYLNMQ